MMHWNQSGKSGQPRCFHLRQVVCLPKPDIPFAPYTNTNTIDSIYSLP